MERVFQKEFGDLPWVSLTCLSKRANRSWLTVSVCQYECVCTHAHGLKCLLFPWTIKTVLFLCFTSSFKFYLLIWYFTCYPNLQSSVPCNHDPTLIKFWTIKLYRYERGVWSKCTWEQHLLKWTQSQYHKQSSSESELQGELRAVRSQLRTVLKINNFMDWGRGGLYSDRQYSIRKTESLQIGNGE